jgi:hypothetical protein
LHLLELPTVFVLALHSVNKSNKHEQHLCQSPIRSNRQILSLYQHQLLFAVILKELHQLTKAVKRQFFLHLSSLLNEVQSPSANGALDSNRQKNDPLAVHRGYVHFTESNYNAIAKIVEET